MTSVAIELSDSMSLKNKI